MFRLTFKGFPDAERKLTYYLRGSGSIGTIRLRLQTGKPYAFGIETGRTRSGRMARRAGGAYMFRDAWRSIQPQIGRAYAQAVPNGDGAVNAVTHQFGARLLAGARARTPVVSGALRASEEVVFR
jgi:hypothetical protein